MGRVSCSNEVWRARQAKSAREEITNARARDKVGHALRFAAKNRTQRSHLTSKKETTSNDINPGRESSSPDRVSSTAPMRPWLTLPLPTKFHRDITFSSSSSHYESSSDDDSSFDDDEESRSAIHSHSKSDSSSSYSNKPPIKELHIQNNMTPCTDLHVSEADLDFLFDEPLIDLREHLVVEI